MFNRAYPLRATIQSYNGVNQAYPWAINHLMVRSEHKSIKKEYFWPRPKADSSQLHT